MPVDGVENGAYENGEGGEGEGEGEGNGRGEYRKGGADIEKGKLRMWEGKMQTGRRGWG